MKKLLLPMLLLAGAAQVQAQITIQLASRPDKNYEHAKVEMFKANVAGSNLDFFQTGAAHTWDLTGMTGDDSTKEKYRAPIEVNPNLSNLMSLYTTLYGYEALDSLPINNAPQNFRHICNYFTKDTVANAFSIAGSSFFKAPGSDSQSYTGVNYPDQDEVFNFPMTYGRSDTTTFRTYARNSITRSGTRYTTVDGYGIVKTPTYPQGIACLRVKSTIMETDRFDLFTPGVDSNEYHHTRYEYNWLNDTIPAPVVTVETVLGIADIEMFSKIYYEGVPLPVVPSGVQELGQGTGAVIIPNPSADGIFRITGFNKPATYTVFDMTGKKVATGKITATDQTLRLQHLPAGNYLLRLSSNEAHYSQKLVIR